MEKEKIERINYLARESRVRELSDEEKAEQTALRNEYRARFKQNLMSELDRVYIEDEKGNQRKLIEDK
ncbi:MAG: DUF896 domain-containing protein [Eubacterium sp.]|nr:DUF896 domain-containing protein [Eubacterium sp.]